MVGRYIKAYPCLQSLVMCSSTFNMTEIEITEGYGNFQTPQIWIGYNETSYQLQRVTARITIRVTIHFFSV